MRLAVSDAAALFAVPFALALALSLALSALTRRLAWRFGFVAIPKADRWHRGTIALLGGLPIWVATLVVVAAVQGFSRETLIVSIGGALALLLGLIDDVDPIKPSGKLGAEIIIACFVCASGLQLHWTGSAVLDALVTILWIVGITNAFNLLDNMDGLCAGVSVIAAIAFCGSIGTGEAESFVYAAALAGATLGFLRFNFNPASMFLGDCGSLFLGSTFALLAVARPRSGQTGLISTLIVPVLILLLPIFDTTFVTISRKLSARAASRGGRDHTSHRLVALGFSERQASLVLYALAGLGGAIAVGLTWANAESLGLSMLLVLALLLLAVHLARVRVYDGDDFRSLRDKAFTPLLIEVTYRRRIFEVLLDTGLISVSYYLAYALRFAEDFRPEYYQLFSTSLPIVIACQLAAFLVAGVYRGVWRYITITDLFAYVRGVAFGGVSMVLTLVYLYRFKGYSRSVFMINAMLVGLLVVGSRLSFRWLSDRAARQRPAVQRAIVCGAGDGGALLVRELNNNPKYESIPIGFLDDDATKRHRRIMGLPVYGTVAEAEAVIARHRPDVIVVSTEKISPASMHALELACERTGTALKQMQFRVTDVPVGRMASV